ncbi:MAG: abortive infection family protein [Proteobacteria bacterium]|nr:abortive infection family protein [Pseudomonadota bacterium]
MRRIIPAPVMSVCAEIAANRETHATLDSLFTYAGAPGDPPAGSKPAKALAWLRLTNKDESIKPLDVLGRLIENYMEAPLDPENSWDQGLLEDRERIAQVLAQSELQYVKGGKVAGALGTPSRTLEEFIRDRDLVSIDAEYTRALANVEASPREAVSAASNILESVCKVYIAEEGLELPAKQDLKPVWTTVRKHLGFDPGTIEDQDLQQILSGLISVVEGIGAIRTHASSAHGAGKKSYKLEPRHARLAIHSAHTIALFILETWHKKKSGF